VQPGHQGTRKGAPDVTDRGLRDRAADVSRLGIYVRSPHSLHHEKWDEPEGAGRSRRPRSSLAPQISNPSDNLKNLFELPVVFYALALYLVATKQVDGVYLGATWAFA
jgi:hypothetical protein